MSWSLSFIVCVQVFVPVPKQSGSPLPWPLFFLSFHVLTFVSQSFLFFCVFPFTLYTKKKGLFTRKISLIHFSLKPNQTPCYSILLLTTPTLIPNRLCTSSDTENFYHILSSRVKSHNQLRHFLFMVEDRHPPPLLTGQAKTNKENLPPLPPSCYPSTLLSGEGFESLLSEGLSCVVSPSPAMVRQPHQCV